MNPDDFLKCESEIHLALLNRENIPLLEELIDKASAEHGKFKFPNSSKVSKADYTSICASVQADVNDFLQSTDVSKPKIRQRKWHEKRLLEGAVYRSGKKEIVHEKEFLESDKFFKSCIAHEYAHHVMQERLGLASFNYEALAEGFACGVERNVCKTSVHTARLLHSLANVYSWLCRHFGVAASEKYDYAESPLYGHPNPYVIGMSWMYMAEHFCGKDVYKEIVRKR